MGDAVVNVRLSPFNFGQRPGAGLFGQFIHTSATGRAEIKLKQAACARLIEAARLGLPWNSCVALLFGEA
jgi:hypothetical protein